MLREYGYDAMLAINGRLARLLVARQCPILSLWRPILGETGSTGI
jgi:hypothetical protein